MFRLLFQREGVGGGGGVGSNFAFLLVEINQSWESGLLAVKGGGLREEGRRTKVKREDDWLQGKRSISIVRLVVTVKREEGCPTHQPPPPGRRVHFILPTLFGFGIGCKHLE